MMIRSWLAAVMRGEVPALTLDESKELSEILAVANEEGVVALIHERLQKPELATVLPSELLGLFADAARWKAVASMFREAECRRILKRLDQEGIPVLLLKGTALAYSVYAAPFLRERADIDFLFPTLQITKQASKVICETDYIQPEIPGDLAVYEMTCFRIRNSSAYLELDLHWGIGGEAVYADRFSFDELFQASMALPALAPTARGLGLVHAYLHATTHRALLIRKGMADYLKWIYDLHVLSQRFRELEWEHLVSVCLKKKLCGTCLHGMQSAIEMFHTSVPDGVRERLSKGALKEPIDMRRMQSWLYLQRMNLRGLPGLWLKARWLLQRLFPSGGYLQHYYGNGQGRLMAFTRYLKKGLSHLRG